MAYHYSPKIVTDGLVFAIDAKNPNSQVSGSTTTYNLKDNDISGSHSASGIADGNMWSFDGSDDYMDFGDVLTDTLIGDYTVDMWFNSNRYSDLRTLITKRKTSDVLNPIVLYVNNSNLVFRLDTVISTPFLSTDTNKWHNVVAKIDGTDMELWFNGELKSTGTSGSRATNDAELLIGNWSLSIPTAFWNGEISSTKIYNRALTSDEIKQNYNTLKGRYGL